MPTSGSEVLREISLAIQNAKRQRDALQSQQRELLQQSDALVRERGKTLVELAENYLPELSQETVRQVWREIQPAIRDVLLRKEMRQRELEEEHERLESTQAQLRHDLETLNHKLETVCGQRDTLSKQLSEQLAGDPAFQQLTDQAAVAEINLQRAESSLDEVEHDVIAKLPAYQRSRLFQYLHKRKMGTPQYTARGWRRRMDRWVSGLIDYPKARKSYEFLSEVPEKMRELIAERRNSLNQLLDRLERAQQKVSAELGLDKVLDQIHSREAQRDDLLQQLEQTVVKTHETGAEIDKLLDSEGPFYAEAVEHYRRLLDQTQTLTLEQRAAQSPDPVDDQLVARLKHLDEEIRRFQQSADSRRQQLKEAEDLAEAIHYLAQQFQRARFDDSRSYFDDQLNIRESLQRLIDGRERPDLLWQHIRRHQHTAPNWYEENSRRVANAANSPMGQILLQTMAHAAGAALRESARRAGSRRMSYPTSSTRKTSRPSMPTPRRSGFSTRRGF
ncbi:hypothetical protein Poly24_10810 [Rosistilla carotiformis]|uniref:Chromosome partition protein Smc n=1 Tax=Rosistilla carotiformis TaxID=2528017 RepID=A0A518JPB5_9BACT|nr:hypothetical protein [Rosistilla carotiformis]QDV67386.1 hypothetical protein Poly24_10810 [Rosistilla carotiformis]